MLDAYTRGQRRNYLGSSDAAALIGKDPWGRTAGDVWAEKTGRVVSQPSSVIMDLGAFLEPTILNWTEQRLDTPILRDLFYTRGRLCANLDGLALSAQPPAVIEAKAIGLIGLPSYLDDFGEPGSDEVPLHTLLQTQHQLAVCETQTDLPPIPIAFVPVLLVRRGFVLYRIEKHQGLCDALVEEGERFWRDHVETDSPPPEAPSMATLRRVLRPLEGGVPIHSELVMEWQFAKEQTKAAREVEETTLRALLTALGDGEVGTCALGTFTYREQTREPYSVPRTTFRVPRFSPNKQEKKPR
jgi:hypothetical protein